MLEFNRSDNITVSNSIGGTGSITQAGPGKLTLATAASNGGGVTVTGGSLGLGVADALPATAPLVIQTGTTLDFGGFSQNVAGLSGGGTITDSGSAATLSVNDSSSSTFSGTISGNLAVTLNGTGTLTFSGTIQIQVG